MSTVNIKCVNHVTLYYTVYTCKLWVHFMIPYFYSLVTVYTSQISNSYLIFSVIQTIQCPWVHKHNKYNHIRTEWNGYQLKCVHSWYCILLNILLILYYRRLLHKFFSPFDKRGRSLLANYLHRMIPASYGTEVEALNTV